MDIAKYAAFFLLSMVKFLFTPFGGPAAGLSYFETYLSCTIGALLSSTIFYFLAEYFLRKSLENKIKLIQKAEATGKEIKHKKKFTPTNKKIIRLKKSLGVFGITFLGPLLLSIPVGTIIVAKFFGKQRFTYPLLLLSILINGLITTGIAYGVAELF